MTSLIEFKNQANILRRFLSKNNQNITQSSCLQAIAKMNGYKDWNTMSADFAKKADVIPVKKRESSSEHVEISKTALLAIANKGKDGKLDEDAIRFLMLILSRLESNSTLINPHIDFLLKPSRSSRALDSLIEENFIIETKYDDYSTYEINPNHFWKGNSINHEQAIKFSSEITENTEGVNYSSLKAQPDIQELNSFFELKLREKEIEFAKEIFNPHK